MSFIYFGYLLLLLLCVSHKTMTAIYIAKPKLIRFESGRKNYKKYKQNLNI